MSLLGEMKLAYMRLRQNLSLKASSFFWQADLGKATLPHPPGLQLLSLPFFGTESEVDFLNLRLLRLVLALIFFFIGIFAVFNYRRRFAFFAFILFFHHTFPFFTFSTYYTADTFALALIFRLYLFSS